jgi:hypothetical protein
LSRGEAEEQQWQPQNHGAQGHEQRRGRKKRRGVTGGEGLGESRCQSPILQTSRASPSSMRASTCRLTQSSAVSAKSARHAVGVRVHCVSHASVYVPSALSMDVAVTAWWSHAHCTASPPAEHSLPIISEGLRGTAGTETHTAALSNMHMHMQRFGIAASALNDSRTVRS